MAMKLYLRIGDWNRQSPRSWNYALGKAERGLSVYALDATGWPVVPDLGEWAETDLRERMRSVEPKYLVRGRRIGTGHDGEPLLANVRIIGDWQEPDEALAGTWR